MNWPRAGLSLRMLTVLGFGFSGLLENYHISAINPIDPKVQGKPETVQAFQTSGFRKRLLPGTPHVANTPPPRRPKACFQANLLVHG